MRQGFRSQAFHLVRVAQQPWQHLRSFYPFGSMELSRRRLKERRNATKEGQSSQSLPHKRGRARIGGRSAVFSSAIWKIIVDERAGCVRKKTRVTLRAMLARQPRCKTCLRFEAAQGRSTDSGGDSIKWPLLVRSGGNLDSWRGHVLLMEEARRGRITARGGSGLASSPEQPGARPLNTAGSRLPGRTMQACIRRPNWKRPPAAGSPWGRPDLPPTMMNKPSQR